MLHPSFSVTKIYLIMSLVLAAILVGCGDTPPPPAEPTVHTTATGTIVLGDVSNEPSKKITRFQPLADYLAANLADFGIGVGQVKIAPDLETMAQWLASGEVDLYFDSPYATMIVIDQAGGQPILRRWKGGDATYHSVIFAHAETGFTTLADLQGQIMALEEPYSTSGYMLPLSELIQANMSPLLKESEGAAVGTDEIGYLFSGEDVNTIQWVLSRRVVAGATDNQIFREIPEESRATLIVLSETEEVARGLVTTSPKMVPAQQEAIKALLIALDETPEGQAILETAVTAQFDEFPQGAEAALNEIRTLYDLVQTQSE